MRSMEQRVSDLVLDVHALQHEHAEMTGVQAATDQAVDHLTMAIGDLSQEQRAMAHDIREINGKIDTLTADVAELKSDVAELKSDVAELKSGMGDVKDALHQILERLPAQ